MRREEGKFDVDLCLRQIKDINNMKIDTMTMYSILNKDKKKKEKNLISIKNKK